MNGSKPAINSTTLVLAGFVVVCGLLGWLAGTEWIKTHPDIASLIVTLVGILGAVYRILFGAPLTVGDKTITRKK